ncbi:MAG: amino acid ABC transporter permease [Acidimicrobiales bacterium]
MAATTVSAMPPANESSPGQWVKKNLFNSTSGSIVTVVLGLISAYLGYRLFRFVFITGQWTAVKTNLTLFLVGPYPRVEPNNQLWRVVIQALAIAGAAGLFAGANSAATERKARAAGLEVTKETPLGLVRRFWSIILFVVVCLSFIHTVTPLLIVLGAIAVGVACFAGARLLPGNLGFVAGALAVVGAYQTVIGTAGAAWIPAALVLGVVAWQRAGKLVPAGLAGVAMKVGVVVVTAVVIKVIYSFFDYQAVGWEKWGGLLLTLTLAACATVFSFPIGLLLALARRSELPVIRWMATIYIEIIRGVPLITLLFMGQFLLGFFIGSTSISNVTRAIVAMTLFTAAYVAEIVRGGLQALPKGQTEAGQALGLAPTQTMRLIVLPQALRAVIPSMVGQFISMFKDTSLVFIVGLTEFLGVRDLIHGQPEFRAVGHAETLVFVAFGYWAFTFAMSRESQNLERKLGVGTR